jgi:hypothetical protein
LRFVDVDAGSAERMRIDSSGNVGIGVTSPTNGKLEVTHSSSTVPAGFFRNTSGSGDSPSLTVQGGANNAAPNFSVLDYDGNTDFVVQGSGNVGIGISSPTSKLHAESNDELQIHAKNSNSAGGQNVYINLETASTSGHPYLRMKNPSTDTSIRGINNGLSFQTGTFTTERMRIDSNGNLRIGTTNAQVTAERVSIAGGLGIQKTDDYPLGLVRGNTYGQIAAFFNYSGTLVGSISVAASSTAYNTSSDYRLKTEVTYDWDATSRLKQLKPARFKWIAEGDDAVFVDGFLAHECEAVPEAVTGEKDAMRDEKYEVTPAVLDEDGNEVTPAVMGTRSVPDYQGIDQSKLVPLLVKTILELEARIAALETA